MGCHVLGKAVEVDGFINRYASVPLAFGRRAVAIVLIQFVLQHSFVFVLLIIC